MLSTVFLLTGQAIVVSKHRGLAHINYPRLYADNAEMAASPAAVTFNCVQRVPDVGKIMTFISEAVFDSSRTDRTVLLGLKHPFLATGAVASYVVSRIAYTRGYASGVPSKVAKFSFILRAKFLTHPDRETTPLCASPSSRLCSCVHDGY
ncbi:hypothetical protein DFH06DRAFT_1419006 [Mycena polygramma]|nr:hypothetical protein DFH06DRAFT_1419006 [Mycena polygramma]